MHKNCPHCGQKFELETGFFYGAMFISYIVTAFLMFSMFAIFKFLMNLDVVTAFVAATLIIFLLFVWLFRVARTIWLTLFVKYNKDLSV
ncbi:MAG: DUF983 domain-containing protein [Saprospiraceae bacterium]|nr:DUF983 domain-containing protein [Saprospiraceae bacterium]